MKKNANGGNPAKPTVEVTETLTSPQVKKIVGEINKLARETVERGQMDIGDLVLKKVFQGSLGAAYSRDPYKSKSLQQVCADGDLMVNRRRLGEWVRAAALRKELMAKKVDCLNLSYSHFAALLQVDDEKKRNKLAATANKEQWSARKLIGEVDKTKVPTVTEGKAGGPGQSSDDKAEKLLQVLVNPLALMEDKEAQQLLANPQDMRDKVTYAVQMQIAGQIDKLIASMLDSANLLKLAKKNIAMITLGDVQADVV